MKLYLNETSPFSRTALITAILTAKADLQLVWVDPWRSPSELQQANPFSVIPTLELNNGTNVMESLAICQFLIAKFHSTAIQLPQLDSDNEASLMGLGKTLMETGFKSVALARFVEQPNELSARAINGLELALTKLNQQLNDQYADLVKQPTLATLYLHCALDYIAFRHKALFETFAQQPIREFMQRSPFTEYLAIASLERLANQPKFQDLVNESVNVSQWHD